MLRGLLAAALVSALGLSASVASAQVAKGETKPYPECTRDPTEGDVGAAKGAFQAGQASFNEADYDRAIFYWEDAFRRDCTANALLMNLARAYELQGNKPQAVIALETFLARQPDSSQRDQITRRIDVLNNQIEQDKQHAQVQPNPQTTTQANPQTTQPTQTPPPDQGGTTEPEPTSSGSRSIVPLVVAGGGVVIGVVGAVLYFPAKSDIDRLRGLCETTPDGKTLCSDQPGGPSGAQLAQEGNSARSKATLGSILGIGGAAIAVGGVVWYFLQPKKADVANAAPAPRLFGAVDVTPVLTDQTQGLVFSGAF
jgi:tetratricopeptide (TPR) repeat protein